MRLFAQSEADTRNFRGVSRVLHLVEARFEKDPSQRLQPFLSQEVNSLSMGVWEVVVPKVCTSF